MKLTISQLRSIIKEEVAKVAGRHNGNKVKGNLSESHARITPGEMKEWMEGNWGFVSEHDGGGPRKYHRDIPSDPMQLRDYVIRTYEGACADIGCDDVSDPEFKDYVADQLAGKVNSLVLQRALAMI